VFNAFDIRPLLAVVIKGNMRTNGASIDIVRRLTIFSLYAYN